MYKNIVYIYSLYSYVLFMVAFENIFHLENHHNYILKKLFFDINT